MIRTYLAGLQTLISIRMPGFTFDFAHCDWSDQSSISFHLRLALDVGAILIRGSLIVFFSDSLLVDILQLLLGQLGMSLYLLEYGLHWHLFREIRLTISEVVRLDVEVFRDCSLRYGLD